jgi:formylglycine-generating enzyme required for sulfatase activity
MNKPWQQALQKNTHDAYQAYLDGQTLKIHAEEAEHKLVEKTQEAEDDEQAWREAEEEDTLSAYQDYLYGSTIKRHAREAKQRLREKAKETEDEKAWQLALQQDTQQAYQTYLYGQTIKIYAQEARQRLMEKTKEAEEEDEQAWQQAIQQDTQSAYQAYLDGETHKKHPHEAKQRLIELAKTQEDEQLWQQAIQQDTLMAYQAYLEGLTIKNHAEEAKQRLVEKTKEIETDENAWQRAEQQDTQAAYHNYLYGNTLKIHAQEAQKRLKEKTKQIEQDEKAWQQALQQDTQAAYQTYLDGPTVKAHADEAEQRLKAFVHKTFKFKTITVNSKGETIQSRSKQAIYDIENLGNGISLEMIYIPGGIFTMGAPANEKGSSEDEYPQHRVQISSFWMSKYPITQAQWQAIMDNNPSAFQGNNRPVEQVSWHDASQFCQRLTEKTGHQYQLPSEAQWEYACRAGTTTPFHFGHTIITDLANYDGNDSYASEAKGKYREQTIDVGQFHPNAFGLYDMHGNVGEWCADLWHDNYSHAPTDGRVWEKGGEKALRLLRGGSWNDIPDDCRAAYRSWYASNSQNDLVGFRVITMNFD